MESMAALEERVEQLLAAVHKLRAENESLRGIVAENEQTIQEPQTKKQNRTTTVGSPEGDSEERQKRLHAATEKLAGLISKLESVG